MGDRGGATVLARRVVPAGSAALVVRAAPAGGARVVARLAPRTRLGSPRVLLAERVRPGWVQVLLPVRPNGTRGWVATRDVRVEPISSRITVDLTSRTIRIVLRGRLVARSPVAVGSLRYRTPKGRYYVTDRVRTPDPSGAYGSFALGLSGYAPALSEFAGGDGQIGVHGTNDPASIGRAVSHGCVRVPKDVESALARVPLGTPVLIG